MPVVVTLVGIELRDYVKDGRQCRFCGLHVVHLEGSSRQVQGCKVESFTCPHEVDPISLKVGDMYQLVYEIYSTSKGNGARLVNLLPVES